jgi:hypothetical protein
MTINSLKTVRSGELHEGEIASGSGVAPGRRRGDRRAAAADADLDTQDVLESLDDFAGRSRANVCAGV